MIMLQFCINIIAHSETYSQLTVVEKLDAGMDWSGVVCRENKVVDLYTPCIVAVQDAGIVNLPMADLRKRFGMGQDEEFHGHECSTEMLISILELALELHIRVGALLIDKSVAPIPSPAHFASLSALRLLNDYLPGTCLSRLWCDEDIKGKKSQAAFKTCIARLQRQFHPHQSVKTSFRDSRKSNLIQVADVVIYSLAWEIGKTRVNPTLKKCLEKLRAETSNLIMRPTRWE